MEEAALTRRQPWPSSFRSFLRSNSVFSPGGEIVRPAQSPPLSGPRLPAGGGIDVLVCLDGLQTEDMTLVWSLIVRAGLGFVFPPLIMLGLQTLAREEISAASGLLNITRQISGMGGIALAGVLLERWHYVHHLAGAEHLASSAADIDQVQHTLEGILQRSGDVGRLLQSQADAVLSRYLSQESLVVAFQDCFIVFTFVFVVAAVASFCIPGGDKVKS